MATITKYKCDQCDSELDDSQCVLKLDFDKEYCTPLHIRFKGELTQLFNSGHFCCLNCFIDFISGKNKPFRT